MQIVTLLRSLRALVVQEGIDRFGVADLLPVQHEVVRQGGAGMARYPRAISIGIDLPHDAVDALPDREQRSVAEMYRTVAYDIVNDRLNLAVSRIGSLVQRAGYRALPIPASKRVDDDRICGPFSHKLAAHCAGLGWIGRSCLLVTPEVGPRVRWGTVLTDAPLDPTGEPLASRCGECRQCVDFCPVGAFSGELFRDDEPREARMDARKCEQYFKQMQADAAWKVCGMCLYVCPHGRNRPKQAQG